MIIYIISWFEKHNKISWIITFIIAIIIYYISSLTFQPGIKGGFPYRSILYHFLAFLGFAGFLLMSLVKGKLNNKTINFFLIAIITSIIYGISDEIHQLFVPGRYFSIEDILTDSAGILIAGFVYLIILVMNNSLLVLQESSESYSL